MLKGAGIDKKEVAENKDAVLDVLEFQSRYQQQQAIGLEAGKILPPKPTPPATAAHPEPDHEFTEADIDPTVLDPHEPVALPNERPIKLGLSFRTFSILLCLTLIVHRGIS